MNFLVITSSLNPASKSALLARHAYESMKAKGETVEWLDLRVPSLPFFDAATVYTNPLVKELNAKIAAADGILLATPVYNYGISASAKNLLELTGSGSAWDGKVVGFLCSAGGQGSYMAIMPFANRLMLDFRCTILPDFVYADSTSFEGDALHAKVADRVERLSARLIGFTHVLESFKLTP